MDSKFNIGEVVMYDGQLYRVHQIHFMNPQIPKDPYVCRIIKLEDSFDITGPAILVREGLLKKANTSAVKVLYGDKSR